MNSSNASACLINGVPLEAGQSEFFSVRYRSFGNPCGPTEIYLGYGTLSKRSDRTGGRVKYWGYGDNTNAFSFSYIPEKDRLTTTVVSPISGRRNIVFDNLSSRFTDPDVLKNLNFIQISIAARSAGVMVALEDVSLNGKLLGSFRAPSAGLDFLTWYLGGYDLSGGFTMSGKIVLNEVTGRFSPWDKSMIQISAGATPIPVAGAVWLFGSGLAGLLALRHKSWVGKRFMRNIPRTKQGIQK